MTTASKRTCPVTASQFLAEATALDMDRVFGSSPTVLTKAFSTGSFGWYDSRKSTVQVAGLPVDVQIGLSITVVGSKPGSETRTKCPVNADEFMSTAKALDVLDLFGPGCKILPRQFSTGSFGWYDSRKAAVRLDKAGEKVVHCQVGLTVTVIGSKLAS